MPCDRRHDLIGAYVDGELGGDDRASMAMHIESCAACRELMGDIERTSRAITELGRAPAPAVLASRIRGRLAVEEQGQAATGLAARRLPSGMWRHAAVLAACCTLSALLTWWIVTASNEADGLRRELVAAHIRSLLQESPIQVASSDSHTVKPWFAGRLEFAPNVKDLTADGFPLAGARLDYIGERRVAALVYRRRLHVVNVFLWPSANGADKAPREFTYRGYNIAAWSTGGIAYWAISDLNMEELRHLQALL